MKRYPTDPHATDDCPYAGKPSESAQPALTDWPSNRAVVLGDDSRLQSHASSVLAELWTLEIL